MTYSTLSPINPFPELPGTSERDNLPCFKRHVTACRWVPAPPFSFLLPAELAESAHQDILAGLER